MDALKKLVKPQKMLDKIRNTFRRRYELYDHSLWNRDRKLRKVPTAIEETLKQVTGHLWYPECGVTKEELHALERYPMEYKMEKLLDAS